MNCKFFLSLLGLFLIFFGCESNEKLTKEDPFEIKTPVESKSPESVPPEMKKPKEESDFQKIHFSSLNPVFRFSAKIDKEWKTEFIPEISAINIYDPFSAESANLQKSQIFIRFFEANEFLTLKTVNILNRQETKIKNHPAVKYEIEKKSGVADFLNQPKWRSQKHKLIDIRFSGQNPTTFYVFAHNPGLEERSFQKFIDSLIFDNDQESFVPPLDKTQERISKKPFGIFITPENSPIQPERFNGFHTGSDFETFENEKDQPVNVLAFCGGKLLEKPYSEGYGGVLIQECMIDIQSVTVLYGHLKLSSIKQEIGKYLISGETIALLGDPGEETDGERKHLHFAIRKGSKIDFRGYVENPENLNEWFDPKKFLYDIL